MDTLPFRLVPATTKLLTTTALLSNRFSPGATRMIARCGASDYVPHSTIMQHFRTELERDFNRSVGGSSGTIASNHRRGGGGDDRHGNSSSSSAGGDGGGLRSSANAFRLMVQAVERFPDNVATCGLTSVAASAMKEGSSSGSGGDDATAVFLENKRWCLANLIHRTVRLIEPNGNAELTPAAALSMVSVLRTDVDAGAMSVLSAATGSDVKLPELSGVVAGSASSSISGGGGSGSGIRLGDAAYHIAAPLEHIMKAPPALRKRLLLLIDVPHCVYVLAQSLCTREAQGLRSTDFALCTLLMLLDITDNWSLVADDMWQRILSNLSLTQQQFLSDSNVNSDSSDCTDNTVVGTTAMTEQRHHHLNHNSGGHVFTSVYEASIAFPAMLAIMSPKAPLVVQETMLGRIGEELFELVVHLHATSSVLMLSRGLLRQTTHDQRIVLCHLLDAEWQRRSGAAAADAAAPTMASSHSFAVRRRATPHPEAYLLVRALLHIDGDMGWDVAKEAMSVLEDDLLHGRVHREATGSTWATLAACLAVAVDVAKGALDVRPEAAATLLRPLRTAAQAGRLDTLLCARSATTLLLHPRLLQLSDDGGNNGLLGEVVRCVVAAVDGGRGCSGFSSAQLQSLLSATDGECALPHGDALRQAVHAGLRALPLRRAEELWG